jgi:hypothetical protein
MKSTGNRSPFDFIMITIRKERFGLEAVQNWPNSSVQPGRPHHNLAASHLPPCGARKSVTGSRITIEPCASRPLLHRREIQAKAHARPSVSFCG